MSNLLPVGVRRDGSYYTRIEWVSHTESNSLFWVCNLIDDDTERNGGTWGANTNGPADVVLSFFGEIQEFSKIRVFHNVGLPISILEELAERINVYVSSTDEPRTLKCNQENPYYKLDKITDVPWNLVMSLQMKKEEGWQEFILEEKVKAKYVRFELVKNFGTPPDIPWVETSEIKMYP